MKQPCHMCLNAAVDDELTTDNDLSYYTVNYYKNNRLMVRSGAGRPLAILAEEWTPDGWVTTNCYNPKCCPNCGRELTEYSNK